MAFAHSDFKQILDEKMLNATIMQACFTELAEFANSINISFSLQSSLEHIPITTQLFAPFPMQILAAP